MSYIGPLPSGKNVLLTKASPTSSGSAVARWTLDADASLVFVYADNITGNFNVKVYCYIGDPTENKRMLLQDFGVMDSSDNGIMVVRKTAATTSQLYVEITYSAACTYEIWVRGAEQGEASVRILGANAGRVSRETVTTTPAIVIPSALTDRSGMVIWNNSDDTTIWWGFSSAEITPAGTEGMPLLPHMPLGIDIASGAELWMVVESGSADIRIAEASS